MLVWRFPRPVWVIASGPLGGGIGVRRWVINATVDGSYARLDPDIHLAELALGLDLDGPGVGMLTAVDVGDAVSAADGGVLVVATVGLAHPTWAAAPGVAAAPDEAGVAPADRAAVDERAAARNEPVHNNTTASGTINIFAWLPVPFAGAALVNAVATVTEAKSQALLQCGVEATGTATDALCLACPTVADLTDLSGDARLEPYGGPRSTWGARLARAVHAVVTDGTRRWFGSAQRDGGVVG